MFVLLRNIRKDGAILGTLSFNGEPVCWTLENEKKAIPAGYYYLENSKSPKFKREQPLVYSHKVPATREIRIHSGNSVKDTSGCVLVGMGRDTVAGSLSESRLAETMVTMLCRTIRHLTVTELG